MTRGNARQDIVQDDDDRNRLLTDLERSILRYDWELLAFVILARLAAWPGEWGGDDAAGADRRYVEA